jgi:hypothetical protein
MWAVFQSTMIDAMSLQYIGPMSVDLAQIFISVTLGEEVTLLANYCWAFFLDIV